MKFGDVLKKGNKIRRSTWKPNYYVELTYNNFQDSNFSLEDLLANDWEIEEEKIFISKSDFYRALSVALKEEFNNKFSFTCYTPYGIETDPEKVVQNMCQYTNWKTLVDKLFGEKK